MHSERLERLLCLFGLLCLTGVAQVAAQTDSIREGYVIVTPTFGDQSRLSAFETFRYRGSSGSSQASVIDSTLSTDASIFVTSDALSGRNSGVALVNAASTSSQVTFTLYRTGGSALDSARLTIPGRQQVTYYITEIFASNAEVQTGFTGLLNVRSSNAVAIVGLRFQDADFSTVPLIRNSLLDPMVPIQPNGAGGPGAVVFPQFASGSGWTTEIVLSNTSNGPISVRVDVFDNDGVPMQSPFASGANQVTMSPNGTAVLSTAGPR